ncbi:MAG: hypothetical protein R3C99_20640 [Pirellulaceae bacterium]
MSQFSPYQSPQFPNHAYAAPPAPRPGVYIGFAIYCGMLALLYLAVAALGVGLMVMSEQVAESDPELDGPMPVILMGVVMMVVCRLPRFSPPDLCCRVNAGCGSTASW